MFQISISPEEIGRLELASFPGEIHVIDSLGDAFGKAVDYLRHQKVIGFDTETRPTFSPDQRSNGTALLQLSGAEKAFLFRIKLMGGIPRRLCAILANPAIVKVGAAIHDDACRRRQPSRRLCRRQRGGCAVRHRKVRNAVPAC